MKRMVLIMTVLLIATPLFAQKYKTALGVRLGRQDLGITLQQKVPEKKTIEAMLTANEYDVELTGLYEWHFPFLLNTFNFYFGIGGHAGISDEFTEQANQYVLKYGIDGIMGIEHKFLLVPIVISLDLKPAVNINYDRIFDMDGAFSIRYILVKEKKTLKERIKDKLNF